MLEFFLSQVFYFSYKLEVLNGHKLRPLQIKIDPQNQSWTGN